MDREYNDYIGDMLEASGEKDNYNGPGKGKPLPKRYLQQDLFQNFQKKAKRRWVSATMVKIVGLDTLLGLVDNSFVRAESRSHVQFLI